MHILIAPDSYKGSLTARQVCDILAQALLTHPGVTVATLPLSDGGEGFGTCCVDACNGDILYTNAVDLYGNTIQAPLYTWGDTALIECAATCALQTKKDIMAASSYGVGMQLKTPKTLVFTILSSALAAAVCATAAPVRWQRLAWHFMTETGLLSPTPPAAIFSGSSGCRSRRVFNIM